MVFRGERSGYQSSVTKFKGGGEILTPNGWGGKAMRALKSLTGDQSTLTEYKGETIKYDDQWERGGVSRTVPQGRSGEFYRFTIPSPPPPLTDKLLLVPNQAHFGARCFPSNHWYHSWSLKIIWIKVQWWVVIYKHTVRAFILPVQPPLG